MNRILRAAGAMLEFALAPVDTAEYIESEESVPIPVSGLMEPLTPVQ